MLSPALPGKFSLWLCNDTTAPNWGHCGDDVQCGGGVRAHDDAAAEAATASPAWVQVCPTFSVNVAAPQPYQRCRAVPAMERTFCCRHVGVPVQLNARNAVCWY